MTILVNSSCPDRVADFLCKRPGKPCPKSRYSRRRVGAGSSADDAIAELERLFRKQQFKDAVKQAKLIYKSEASAENHKRLERAYSLRADQLYRSGMITSAVEVAGHLLEFGVTDVSLIEEFAALLMRLGMAAEAYRIQGRVESPEARSRLAEIAADQAVLHPDRSKPDSPQVALEAARVRQALEALETRDDTKALELVREIARSSPLSEWKLFVRGLAAFYRRDSAEAQANWDRLDADRAPFRIVKRLRNLEAGKPAIAGPGSERRRPGKHGLRREHPPPFERAQHSGEQAAMDRDPPQNPRVAG